MNIHAQHRDRVGLPPVDFDFHLRRLRPIIDLLAGKDRTLGNWYLQGQTEWQARQDRVYDGQEPSAVAVEAMKMEYQREAADDPKAIGIWNGANSDDDAASFLISIDGGDVLPRSFDLDLNEVNAGLSRLGNYKACAEVMAKVVEIYDSFYVRFGPREYNQKQVFRERPGASWMLYLPRVLTMQEVPEARDLIPVIVEGQQKGTIIVSEIDDVFSVDNPEHVKVANAIEIRLVDQDLLPRFVDL
jgi:hypothetical protein